MKLAILYAGQGSQHPGMGKDLYERYPAFREAFNAADLDFDLESVCFDDPEGVLNLTQYTQPCMVAFAAGVTAVLYEKGVRPAMAAAVIISSTLPNYWSPGSTDNIYVAKLANIPVMDMVTYVAPTTLILSALSIVFVMIVCLLFKDYRKEGFGSTGVHPGEDIQKKLPDLPEKPNLLMAFAPLLPVVLLFVISLCFPGVKMSVATAMLMGLIYVMIVTRLNPQQLCSKFFDGMGSGYGSILGIIIAAGVFASGLRATGVIDLFVNYLTHANEVAKIGGSVGPYVFGVLTGSGDAAAFAFNEAVTPHAAEFGMKIDGLGYLAMIAAGLGRMSSPLAGGLILLSGIAGVSPIEVVKRTAPAAIITLGILYFLV